MKLLVDMNLSPRWVDRLARHGFDAVHWPTVGAATAPDHEILAWAHQHSLVLVTNDLDFSAILAAGAVDGPSVVLIRTQDLFSDTVVSITHRWTVTRPSFASLVARVWTREGGTGCPARWARSRPGMLRSRP